METKLLYITGGIIVSLLLFNTCFFIQPCKQCKKPSKVPDSAVWIGGCDGGNWVELVNIKADTIRLRIYRDWDGELILDADYVPHNCNNLFFTEADWEKHFNYFDGTKFYIKNQCSCQLTPVYPLYYMEN